MRKWILGLTVLACALATAIGPTAAKKKAMLLNPGMYTGKAPAEAAQALLEVARGAAGSGSWEKINVARVHLLSGQKEEAQALIDDILKDSKDAGDLVRAGRAFYEAGDWAKAKALFDRALEQEPTDEDWLAEIGAYYNLQGDRAHAEELFGRCFDQGEALKNILTAAGSYVGVSPLRRP